jgi:hypothetical protein
MSPEDIDDIVHGYAESFAEGLRSGRIAARPERKRAKLPLWAVSPSTEARLRPRVRAVSWSLEAGQDALTIPPVLYTRPRHPLGAHAYDPRRTHRSSARCRRSDRRGRCRSGTDCAPPVTPDLLANLKTHKAELLEALAHPADVALWWRVAITEPGDRTVEVDAPSGCTLADLAKHYAECYHGPGCAVTPIAGLPKPPGARQTSMRP